MVYGSSTFNNVYKNIPKDTNNTNNSITMFTTTTTSTHQFCGLKKRKQHHPLLVLSGLDIGCGGGLLCESAYPFGCFKVTSFDLSIPLIQAVIPHQLAQHAQQPTQQQQAQAHTKMMIKNDTNSYYRTIEHFDGIIDQDISKIIRYCILQDCFKIQQKIIWNRSKDNYSVQQRAEKR